MWWEGDKGALYAGEMQRQKAGLAAEETQSGNRFGQKSQLLKALTPLARRSFRPVSRWENLGIHPVVFSGKVWAPRGANVYVYGAIAGYDNQDWFWVSSAKARWPQREKSDVDAVVAAIAEGSCKHR